MNNFIFTFAFICFVFPTVTCLSCNKNSTTDPSGIEVVECDAPYCYVMGVMSGSDYTLNYVELEGCETEILQNPTLSIFNLTCKDQLQSGNTTLIGIPFYGMLYCCKEDKCNTEIPGFTLPPKPSPTTSTTTTTTTTPSPSTSISPSSSTNDGIKMLPNQFFFAFLLSIFMVTKVL